MNGCAARRAGTPDSARPSPESPLLFPHACARAIRGPTLRSSARAPGTQSHSAHQEGRAPVAAHWTTRQWQPAGDPRLASVPALSSNAELTHSAARLRHVGAAGTSRGSGSRSMRRSKTLAWRTSAAVTTRWTPAASRYRSASAAFCGPTASTASIAPTSCRRGRRLARTRRLCAVALFGPVRWSLPLLLRHRPARCRFPHPPPFR